MATENNAHNALNAQVEWKIKRKIMDVIVKSGGTVFGGAVRDMVLHDSHATEFYKRTKLTHAELEAAYNDPLYMPEYNGRYVIPDDIDACLHIDHLENVLAQLKAQHLNIHLSFSRDPTEYFPTMNIEPGTVRHDRYIVKLFKPFKLMKSIYDMLASPLFNAVASEVQCLTRKIIGLSCTIKLDFMISTVPLHLQQPEPPFGFVDFDCNALLYTKNGITLSQKLWPTSTFDPYAKTMKMIEIFKDIEARRAVMCIFAKPQDYRIRKMMRKGWEIGSDAITQLKDKTYDGHCLICQGDLNNSTQYKLKCCDARYHINCMRDAFGIGVAAMASTGRCVMCQKTISWPQHANTFLIAKSSALQLQIPDPNDPII